MLTAGDNGVVRRIARIEVFNLTAQSDKAPDGNVDSTAVSKRAMSDVPRGRIALAVDAKLALLIDGQPAAHEHPRRDARERRKFNGNVRREKKGGDVPGKRPVGGANATVITGNKLDATVDSKRTGMEQAATVREAESAIGIDVKRSAADRRASASEKCAQASCNFVLLGTERHGGKKNRGQDEMRRKKAMSGHSI